MKSKSPCILYMSSYPPRECGIATFTKHLTAALDKEFSPEIQNKILAMNYSGTSIYNYPRKVIKQINETEIEDYLNRANEINKMPHIKAVNIQHEYGLFGGEFGEYLLMFLELLKKPVILTFHTILPKPEEKMKKITRILTEKATAVVVMANTPAKMLHEIYGVHKNKIFIIPHGVPHVTFPSKSRFKKRLNLQGRIVLSTIGMLGRDKGIEYAIEALPEVIAEYPNILYLIIGATHPVVLHNEGEKYRNKLKRIIQKNNLQEHVKFYDKYLDDREYIDFLRATDIYISPTLNPRQAVSGTISEALSCACPIISTANQYARDVIDDGRGILVRFKKSGDIKNALSRILSDRKAMKEMGKNSYFYSRHMTWQNVALSYFKIFNEYAKIRPRDKSKLPPVNLSHVKTLTDDFGIIQFAQHTKPDTNSGYCVDDNARALLGCAEEYARKKSIAVLKLVKIYLNLLKYTQMSDGKFNNFISYNKTFLLDGESQDSFGRVIWALGYVTAEESLPEDIRKEAKKILNKAVKQISEISSLRAVSFAIIGLSHLIENEKRIGNDAEQYLKTLEKLCNQLIKCFNKTTKSKNNWTWFEDCLTYSNFKLPEALFRAYKITKNKEYLHVAEKSIKFISDISFEKKDYFSPIGQDGWYYRNGKRAYFDQQPEDASSAVEALTTAYEITKKKYYKEKAELAFQWFLGKNHLSQMVYDEATGGCYDGVGKYSLNFNQGAESTLSYFLARLAIEKV
ncbi:MAG: glycosyltransferase [bacterium]